MKQKMMRVLCFVFAVIMACGIIPFSAFAVGSANPMQSTGVMNDLRTMGFDLGVYGKDEGARRVSVVHFLEYGYDCKGDQRYYGLYLYLYNPSGKPLDLYGSYLQMSYKKSNASFTQYAKYAVKILDVSVDTGYEALLYKLQVDIPATVGKEIHGGAREYKLSGITLNYQDDAYDNEYALSEHWRYTGFQPYFNRTEDENTELLYSRTSLETVTIDLKSASWLSDSSVLGEDYRWEVSSVYFAIPQDIIKRYGDPFNKNSDTRGLYSVRGEYYKYATNGLLLPDDTYYEDFRHILYTDVVNSAPGGDQCYDDYPCFATQFHVSPIGITPSWAGYCDITFNTYHGLYMLGSSLGLVTGTQLTVNVDPDFRIPILKNVAVSANGYLSSDALYQIYVDGGRAKFGKVQVSGLKSGSNFDRIGERVPYYITVDDGTLNDQLIPFAQSSGANWLHKLFNKELYTDENGYLDMDPIVEVTGKNISSEQLFVHEEDAKDIQAYYDQYKGDSYVYLMRFSVDPYYCPQVMISENNLWFDETQKGYYFEKAVFENFDVMEFTFLNEDGGETILPVICKPIDIVGSISPGNNTVDPNPNDNLGDQTPGGAGDGKDKDFEINWLRVLVITVIGIAVFIFLLWLLTKLGIPLAPVLGFIGNAIGAVFKAIFAVFGAIFKGIGSVFAFGISNSKTKNKRDLDERLMSVRERDTDSRIEERNANSKRKDNELTHRKEKDYANFNLSLAKEMREQEKHAHQKSGWKEEVPTVEIKAEVKSEEETKE